MQRFWETAVLPVLEAIEPENIVEIGSDYGYNTRKLLRFCKERGAKLHVVDPLPKYDIQEWQEEQGEALVFYRFMSLNAIPLISQIDAVLIDGDHNWYTVFNELKLIEKRCKELSQPFPLVMLHDIGWPYGRRDLYYDPETVPQAYRKPHAKKGMRPDTPDLVENGGLNSHLHNAIYENSMQNGVLTAVEDFLEDTEQEIEMVTLPGLHGLGILVPAHLKERDGNIEEVLGALRLSPVARRHAEQIESDRLLTLVERYEQHLEIRRQQAQNRELAHNVPRLDADVQRSTRMLQTLEREFAMLLSSRRWQFAYSLAELRQRALLKPRVPTAVDSINRTLEQFRSWRKAGGGAKRKADVAEHTGEDASGGERQRPKVSVLVWEMSWNPMGRARLIADVLSRKFEVELVGFEFPRYGDKVWGPVRDGRVPTVELTGQDFPEHFAELERAAQRIDGDVLFVSKPRLPSYELGILAKIFKNRPLILDVDDREASFFEEQGSLSLEELEERRDEDEFEKPYGALWTRYCDSIIGGADHVTVSNPELQKLYGGTIFPHVRDERRFDPALYDREALRAELGFAPDDRVIVFIGTPRKHKGVVEIAKALEKIGNPKYKLCVMGTIGDPDVRVRLERLQGDYVTVVPDQPFENLPANLAIGDLVCLLQDRNSAISGYQMPAKFTDALAMGIPILANDPPPLANLAEEGLVEPLGDTPIHQKISSIFSNYASFKEKALANRERFLSEYSYAAMAPKLESMVLSLLEETPPVPEEFKELVEFQREVFSPDVLRKAELGKTVEKRRVRRLEEKRKYVDDKYDVVVFWKQNDSDIYGRRQDMLVKYLAASPKVNKVLHFDKPMEAKRLLSMPGLDEGTKSSQSNQVFLQTMKRYLRTQDSEKVKRHTFVYASPPGGGRILEKLLPDHGDFMGYIANALRRHGVSGRRTVFWFYPTNSRIPEIIDFFDPEFVVTDVVDDERKWLQPDSPRIESMTEDYRQALGASDLVITNSQFLKEKMHRHADAAHLVPNACEPPQEVTWKKGKPRELASLEGPIIGYVGNLTVRVDTELLEYVAASRPGWNLVLIGQAPSKAKIARLAAYGNVHMLGVRSYPDVQRYIKEFDVAIMPHLNDEMTEAMNPLKPFVYAAMGVPIVSTEIGGLSELREIMYVAMDKETFVEKTEAALTEPLSPAADGRRAEILENNSWERRVEAILRLIDNRWFEKPTATKR